MEADGRRGPLVVLALDVGDHAAILEWTRQGYLPTLASIVARGCWGRTAGAELACEHGIWISLVSGISRGEHGYYALQQLRPGTYDLQAVTHRDVDAPPFWTHLRGRGTRVAVVDVPELDPLPGLAGVQVAEWATHFPLFPPATEPSRLLEEIRRAVGPRVVTAERLRSSVGRDYRIYQQLRARVERKGALCRYLLRHGPFDLIVASFSETHTASHQFWKYRPEARGPDARVGAHGLTHAIRDTYRAIDREMGLLLQQLPTNADVVVVSSTGIEDKYPIIGLAEEFCRALGYQAAPPPARPSASPLALSRRALPERWRIAISRHLPYRVQQRLVADRFRSGVDWDTTTLFPIPGIFSTFLRVNLRGREPRGTVNAGTEYDALLARAEADLRQLVDPVGGGPAVKHVARAAELYSAGIPSTLPDLFVQWEPAAHFRRRLVHPRAELTQPVPGFYRGNNHTEHGFIAAAGPSIRVRGEIDDIDVLDLAPTFLALLGQPIPPRLRGTPLAALGGGRAAP